MQQLLLALELERCDIIAAWCVTCRRNACVCGNSRALVVPLSTGAMLQSRGVGLGGGGGKQPFFYTFHCRREGTHTVTKAVPKRKRRYGVLPLLLKLVGRQSPPPLPLSPC